MENILRKGFHIIRPWRGGLNLQTSLKIGDVAPDFSLPATTKDNLALSDYRGKKNTVVAFYGMDFTPGWIKEIASWKEDYKRFEQLDAEVLAISVDHIHSHRVFAASMGTLPYPLVSDWHKQTVKNYDVFNEKGETAIRSVFVVNKARVITYVNTSFKADKKEDYEAVFSELERLSNEDMS
jgi:peroxiredoxin